MAANKIPEDFTGRRYGLWSVLSFSHTSPQRMRYWCCRCDCGKECTVSGPDLKRGGTTGCGCTRVLTNARHGHTKGGETSREYRAWGRMIQRCTNPNHIGYANYGGRGIAVCEEWLDYARFFTDMGPKPSPRHSLERTNNLLGYSKENCVWATKQTQINNRRVTIFVDLDGERLPLGEACRKTGVRYNVAYGRMKLGWPEDRWFT